MRFLLALPLPLLLILSWIAVFFSHAAPIESSEEPSWPAVRRFVRSATDPSSLASSGNSNTIDYDAMPEDTLKTELDGAKSEEARLKNEIESKRAALDAKVTENAAPKADLETKNRTYIDKSKIYDDLEKDLKETQEKATREFNDAEDADNLAQSVVDQTHTDLESLQNLLQTAKDRRDQLAAIPGKLAAAKQDLQTNTDAEANLNTAVTTANSEKTKKTTAYKKLNTTIENLTNKLTDKSCTPQSAVEICVNTEKGISEAKSQLPNAAADYATALSDWTTAKEELKKCRTAIRTLPGKISLMETDMKTQPADLSAAQQTVATLEPKEQPAIQAHNEAVAAKTITEGTLATKQIAKDAADAAVDNPTDAVKTAEQESNYAYSEFFAAEAVFRPMQTAEDKLKEELKELEKNFESEQVKVAAMIDAYEKKTAAHIGKGSLQTTLIAIFVVLLVLVIIGIVVGKFVLWPFLKKKREEKAAPAKGDPSKGSSISKPDGASAKPAESAVAVPGNAADSMPFAASNRDQDAAPLPAA